MVIHANAGGRAVPGEDDVGIVARLAEVRQHAVVADMDFAISQLELFLRVGDPVLAEAFPGKDIDRLAAEHRPHAHLDGTCIGRRHDGNAVIGRQVENRLGAVDRFLQFRLRIPGAVRAAKGGRFKL